MPWKRRRILRRAKKWASFCGSERVLKLLVEVDPWADLFVSGSDSESEAAGCSFTVYGSTSYSPVSQMSIVPVWALAVSMT